MNVKNFKIDSIKGISLKAVQFFYQKGSGKIRLIDCDFKLFSNIKFYGLLKCIYGYDLFFNNIPFLKCLLLANVIVWLIMYFTLR